jgi:P-type Cu+ transporter
MNTLVSLGTGVAFAYSAYATIAPAPGRAVYFDAVLLIVGFLLLGKAWRRGQSGGRWRRSTRFRDCGRRRAAPGVTALQTVVPLEEVRIGDSVVVLPGERFPVDATIMLKGARQWMSRC